MIDRDFLKKALHDSLPLLGASEYEKLALFSNLVLKENEKYNLTSITDETEFACKHLLDSLMFVSINNDMSKLTIADTGTGAGFPGIPLAITCPEGKFTLIESNAKKCAFISEAVKTLGLKNVSVITGRAESLSHEPRHREKYDIVMCRALASFSIAVEINGALVKQGGTFCFYSGRNQTKEILSSGGAPAHKVGMKIESSFDYSLPLSMGCHSLIIVKKLWKTDKAYPREFQKIKKKPL